MQPVLYIDILVILNTVITFFLLMTTGEITRVSPTPGRVTVASLVGGVYALIILAPSMSVCLIFLTKVVIAVTLVGIAFPLHKIRAFCRELTVFLLLSFLYAGVVYAMQYAFSVEFIKVNNGFAYYNMPASAVIVICLLLSFIIKAVNSGFFRNDEKNNIFKTEIFFDGKSIVTDALFDTGNELRDAYTDAPVIVLCQPEAQLLAGEKSVFFPVDQTYASPLAIRLIPVKTITGQSVLPAFTVDKAVIYSDEKLRTLIHPTVAVTNDALGKEKYRALINCDLV